MPNLPNAQKALRQAQKREEHNKKYRNRVKKLTRRFNDLVKEGKTDDAEKLLPTTYKAIDKAAKKNILPKNRASRKKSVLARSLKEPAKPVSTEKPKEVKEEPKEKTAE